MRHRTFTYGIAVDILTPPPGADNSDPFDCSNSRDFWLEPVTPSAVGLRPAAHLRPGDRVILCLRVSSWEQDRDPGGSHLDDQMIDLYRVAKAREAAVVGVHRRVWPGNDPLWLWWPVEMAKELDADLLGESTSRLLRSPSFDPKDEYFWKARPLRRDFVEFLGLTKGGRLFTAVDPDATAEEERAYESARGARMKEERPTGRGRKRWWKEVARPLVKELKAAGHGIRPIARMTGIPASLASDWLRIEPTAPVDTTILSGSGRAGAL